MATEGNTIWGDEGVRRTVAQIAHLVEGKFPRLHVHLRSDGRGFAAVPPDDADEPEGVLGIHGQATDGPVITLRVELARAGNGVNVRAEAFFEALGETGDHGHLFTQNGQDGMRTLGMELQIKAEPMGMARSNVLTTELGKLDDLAKVLQAEIPKSLTSPNVAAAYANLKEFITLVEPFGKPKDEAEQELYDWAVRVLAFAEGGASVAVAGEEEAVTSLALALIAQATLATGSSLGAPVPTMLNPQTMMELARKAPGLLAVPAASLGLGSQRYDLGQDIMAMLTALRSANQAVIFQGRMTELQSVFHGGQGGESDPLKPVLCRVPPIPTHVLVRFCVQRVALATGKLSSRQAESLEQELLQAMSSMGTEQCLRLLPVTVSWAVKSAMLGRDTDAAAIQAYMERIGAQSESLSGLPDRPRNVRAPHVQGRFTEKLVRPGLLAHLKRSLISQDIALGEFSQRMLTEALTRPDHQPLRCALVGTAATGKTQCVAETARYLGVPYANVDAASMPDFYTASAQLLGSGRGIVNSHKSGRLEQIAKHHIGAILETSDIDHAPASVRGPLGDLYLQMLESGEAQAASGAMFSVSNVIFVFTMNLPGGEDETARRSIGFGQRLDRRDIRERMVESLKRNFSAAFLSRLGLPIIFDPLGEDDVAILVERTIREAAASALTRLGIHPLGLTVESGTGARVMASFASNLISFGARAVLEHGRDLAAAAVVATVGSTDLSGKDLVLLANGTSLQLRVRHSDEDSTVCLP
jgi:hypothetical protein